jgi:hypothetical protein
LFCFFISGCLNFLCSYNGRDRKLEHASLHEGCQGLQRDNEQMVLSDVDIGGIGVIVEARFVFIRRAAQTPADVTVSVVDNTGTSDLGEIDEVVAMRRVHSAGGTESSEAIFKSDQARVFHAEHEQFDSGKKKKKKNKKKKREKQSIAAVASLQEYSQDLQRDNEQMATVDIGGIGVTVEARPMFIRRAAQTPADVTVSVSNNTGTSDLADIDEVVAMRRVRSAGGTESSEAIFKSDQARGADV